jgi:hypothetical protein
MCLPLQQNKEKVTKNTLLTKIDFCNSGVILVLFHQLKHTLFDIDIFIMKAHSKQLSRNKGCYFRTPLYVFLNKCLR